VGGVALLLHSAGQLVTVYRNKKKKQKKKTREEKRASFCSIRVQVENSPVPGAKEGEGSEALSLDLHSSLLLPPPPSSSLGFQAEEALALLTACLEVSLVQPIATDLGRKGGGATLILRPMCDVYDIGLPGSTFQACTPLAVCQVQGLVAEPRVPLEAVESLPVKSSQPM